MSKTVGVILILAGMGVASSLLAIGSDAEQDPRRSGNGEGRSADNPSIVATVPATPSPARTIQPVAVAPQPAQRRTAPPSAAAPRMAATFSAPVVVTLPYRAEPAPPAAKQRVARMPRDRASMARDLQLELRRVGCYGGELNGIWTAATRKAMKAFTDRVNATLPVEVPDEILLTLVQAHQGEACGKPCPPGQGLSDDGRCLPGAILAQAAKKGTSHSAMAARQNAGQPAEKPTAAIAPWTATTAAAIPAPLPGPRPVGRMALAGPTIATPPLAAESPPGSPVPAALLARASRPDRSARGRPGCASGRSGTCRVPTAAAAASWSPCCSAGILCSDGLRRRFTRTASVRPCPGHAGAPRTGRGCP